MIRECVSSVHVQLSCTTCLLCRQSIRTARVMLRPCWTRILMHFSSRKHQQSALGNGSIFQSPRRRCLGRWRTEPQHVRRQSHYSLTGGKHGRKLRGTVSVPGTMGSNLKRQLGLKISGGMLVKLCLHPNPEPIWHSSDCPRRSTMICDLDPELGS